MFDIFMSKSDPRSSISGQNNPFSSFMSNVGQSFTMEMSKLLEPLSVKDMQQTMKKCQSFFKAIDNWKNLEQYYVNKLSQIQNTFRQKIFPSNQNNKQKDNTQNGFEGMNLSSSDMIDSELILLFDTLIKNHKTMFQKITYDISYVNLDSFQSLSKQIKLILNQQKTSTKQLNTVKQQLQKVFLKKTKLRKQKQQQLMLKIFMEDGTQQFMMDQKMKKNNKYNQIKKQYLQYELKVSQSVEEYQKSSENLKKNHLEYYEKIDRLYQCKYQTVMKMQLHLLSYYRNLVQGINSLNKNIQFCMDENNSEINKQKMLQNKTKIIYEQMSRKQKQNKFKIQQSRKNEFQILDKLLEKNPGYVEYSLKLIEQKQFDDLLTYSKDKQVKSKVKRMIDSNDINPQQTDQTCRQIQLIKKFIRSQNEQTSLLQIFKNMINKNSKLRMNFIFILQFYRINGKFQMTIEQFKPYYTLINEFIATCHSTKDCFVLKQLMILLTTYYVVLNEDREDNENVSNQKLETQDQNISSKIKENDSIDQSASTKNQQMQQIKKKPSSSSKPSSSLNLVGQKIYILQFFKDHQLWHDVQFWQSLLIECIYSQKRNTIKNLVRGLQSTQRKQMLQAQKTSILNQILYVVRNMIIFDFSEKDVKNFGFRFCKLLKIDDKNIKDVYKTVEQAIKQEKQTKQNQSIDKYLLKILK